MRRRIAINGFGRIGKAFLRAVLSDTHAAKKLEVVAINEGPFPMEHLDIGFKYDSVLGQFPGVVTSNDTLLTIGDRTIRRYAEKDPTKLPWEELKVDWVVEASGLYTSYEDASMHLQAGAQKVLISAPSRDADTTVIPGLDETPYYPNDHHIVSLGSCTTNCLAVVLSILREAVTIEHCMMTTVHAYTNSQVLLDVNEGDARKSRAAGLNIIPTTTGASKVITKVFPDLAGKIEAMAIRVPVANVSMIDLSIALSEDVTVEALNELFAQASKTKLQGVLGYSDQPLVSSDYIGSPHAAIVDGLLTRRCGSLYKICAWYDNEFGYSSRMKDFLLHNA